MKKVIHKSFFKRGTAILLALVCLISAICLVPINAASREVRHRRQYHRLCAVHGTRWLCCRHGWRRTVYHSGRRRRCLLYRARSFALLRQYTDNRCFCGLERTQQGSEEGGQPRPSFRKVRQRREFGRNGRSEMDRNSACSLGILHWLPRRFNL